MLMLLSSFFFFLLEMFALFEELSYFLSAFRKAIAVKNPDMVFIPGWLPFIDSLNK